MFEKLERWVRGVFGMFGVETIKTLYGEIPFTNDMVDAINLWSLMYYGRAPWIDSNIKSLRTEQSICREFANVVISEMTSQVSNDKLNKLYQAAIADLNERLQRGMAIGSFIVRPVTDGIEYITADQFIPIKFSNAGKLIDVALIDTRQIKTDLIYYRLERHTLQDGKLTISNRVFMSTRAGELGIERSLTNVDEWASLPPIIQYEYDKPDFGYYRNPIDNTVDASKCGISMFEPAIDKIKKTDIQFGRLDWEFESGERAVHVDSAALRKKANGSYTLPKLNDRLYRGLDISKTNGELLDVFSPEFRDQSIINGLETYKREIEFSVGLSYGDLSKQLEQVKTAAEVKASKKRKYNMVNAIQSNLKDCLSELVDAIAFYNAMTTVKYEFICNFQDSIMVDDETERAQDRQDVAMGVMSQQEYRAKWYGETEEEALSRLPKDANML